MAHISDIKLIRTDTTLDLSQKAEKAIQSHTPQADYSTHLSPNTVNKSGIDTNLIGEEYDDESLLLFSMDLTTLLWLKSELTKMILHPYSTSLCERLIMGLTCP
ncbi:hypothetical protein PIB30_065535 [Stylosanthes scabra]|uniref:Uncharacterized protein n=1 Tax=Stylosanthes scabra TaxID=79078 RepID=A0ABU6SNA8_9FABA|nr:hypothetical protein [Stylosanthes scabra]